MNDYISVSNNTENAENQEDNPTSIVDDNEMQLPLKRAYLIYQQATECVNDIKFIIELLKISEKYNNTEKLQKKIIRYKCVYICIRSIGKFYTTISSRVSTCISFSPLKMSHSIEMESTNCHHTGNRSLVN